MFEAVILVVDDELMLDVSVSITTSDFVSVDESVMLAPVYTNDVVYIHTKTSTRATTTTTTTFNILG